MIVLRSFLCTNDVEITAKFHSAVFFILTLIPFGLSFWIISSVKDEDLHVAAILCVFYVTWDVLIYGILILGVYKRILACIGLWLFHGYLERMVFFVLFVIANALIATIVDETPVAILIVPVLLLVMGIQFYNTCVIYSFYEMLRQSRNGYIRTTGRPQQQALHNSNYNFGHSESNIQPSIQLPRVEILQKPARVQTNYY